MNEGIGRRRRQGKSKPTIRATVRAVAAISRDDGAEWIVLPARLSILRWRGFRHISTTR
jgi:hypothetical protein